MDKKNEFEGIPRNNAKIILSYSIKGEDYGWTEEYVNEVFELITDDPESEGLEEDCLQINIG